MNNIRLIATACNMALAICKNRAAVLILLIINVQHCTYYATYSYMYYVQYHKCHLLDYYATAPFNRLAAIYGPSQLVGCYSEKVHGLCNFGPIEMAACIQCYSILFGTHQTGYTGTIDRVHGLQC